MRKFCFLDQMKMILITILLFSQSAFASWVTTYQDVIATISADHTFHESVAIPQIPSSKDFNELEQNYGNEDLKNIYWSMTPDQVLKNNENIKTLLEQDIIGEAEKLSSSEIRRIFRYTESSYVVKKEERYDKDEVIGFCFGRAFIAHHQARLREVDPDNIKKIWIVGDMKKWGHHVATILRGDKGWMVIDTYTGLLTVETWIKRMEQDKKRSSDELMFFVINATRFGHQNNNLHNSIDLFNSPEETLLEFEDKEATRELK